MITSIVFPRQSGSIKAELARGRSLREVDDGACTAWQHLSLSVTISECRKKIMVEGCFKACSFVGIDGQSQRAGGRKTAWRRASSIMFA